MTEAVEHDLRHGPLPNRVVAGFVEHRGGEAIHGTGAVFDAAGEQEGPCGGLRPVHRGHGGVVGARIVGRQRDELDGLDRRQLGRGHHPLGRQLRRDASRGRRWGVADEQRGNGEGK